MNSLTIVTGSSSNHFLCLKNLLFSISLFEPKTRTIIYDLGLKNSELEELESGPCEIRKFRFEEYPEYFRINDSQYYTGLKINKGHNSGCYAWKPVIINNLVQESCGMVLWLDAGDLVHK